MKILLAGQIVFPRSLLTKPNVPLLKYELSKTEIILVEATLICVSKFAGNPFKSVRLERFKRICLGGPVSNLCRPVATDVVRGLAPACGTVYNNKGGVIKHLDTRVGSSDNTTVHKCPANFAGLVI